MKHIGFVSINLFYYRQALLDMNRWPPNEKIYKEKSLAAEIKKYKEWKMAREQRMA